MASPHPGRPANKALHQTRRGGAVASRPVVEARLAGEGRCCAGIAVRHLRPLEAALVVLLSALAQAACSEAEHSLRIENRSERVVRGVTVGINSRRVQVPVLDSGQSTVVRLRINAEAGWEVYFGDHKAGECGYIDGPSQHQLILVSPGRPARDCEVPVA